MWRQCLLCSFSFICLCYSDYGVLLIKDIQLDFYFFIFPFHLLFCLEPNIPTSYSTWINSSSISLCFYTYCSIVMIDICCLWVRCHRMFIVTSNGKLWRMLRGKFWWPFTWGKRFATRKALNKTKRKTCLLERRVSIISLEYLINCLRYEQYSKNKLNFTSGKCRSTSSKDCFF